MKAILISGALIRPLDTTAHESCCHFMFLLLNGEERTGRGREKSRPGSAGMACPNIPVENDTSGPALSGVVVLAPAHSKLGAIFPLVLFWKRRRQRARQETAQVEGG